MHKLIIITGGHLAFREAALKLQTKNQKVNRVEIFNISNLNTVLENDKPATLVIKEISLDDIMLPQLLQPTYTANRQRTGSTYTADQLPMPTIIITTPDDFVCPQIFAHQVHVIKWQTFDNDFIAGC